MICVELLLNSKGQIRKFARIKNRYIRAIKDIKWLANVLHNVANLAHKQKCWRSEFQWHNIIGVWCKRPQQRGGWSLPVRGRWIWHAVSESGTTAVSYRALCIAAYDSTELGRTFINTVCGRQLQLRIRKSLEIQSIKL